MLLANQRAVNLFSSKHHRQPQNRINWNHVKKVALEIGKNVALLIVQRTLLSPIEVVITRMQTMKQLIKDGVLDQQYVGFWDCIMHIIKQEGFFALWKGNMTRILLYLTTKLLLLKLQPFFVDLVYNKLLKKNDFRYPFQSRKRQRAWKQYLRVILTNVFINQSILFLVYPLHFAHVKFTTDINSIKKGIPCKYSGYKDLFQKTIQSEGISKIYSGYGCCLLAPVLFVFMTKLLYGELPYYNIKQPQGMQILYKTLKDFAINQASVIPLQIVKQRMIVNGKDSKETYKNIFDCADKIKKREGLGSFFYSLKYYFLNSMIGNFWFHISPIFYLILLYKWYNQNINVD